MDRGYEVVWTELAVADLQSITEYLAARNPSAAEHFGEAIFKHVEMLKTVPLIGVRYRRGSSTSIREIACGKYRIFYRPNEETRAVEILTIWHSSRDEPDLPN